MNRFPDKMRDKEQAEEDRYFAQRDRELLAALKAKESKDTQPDAESPPENGDLETKPSNPMLSVT